MKEPILLTATRNGAKRMPVGLFVALAMTLLRQDAMATPDVNLGTANDFLILAGSAITFTGPNTISGDIGSYPTTSITGLAGVTFVSGANETSDTGLMISAKNNLTTAYNTAVGLKPAQAITTGNLGGLTLTPGVYSFSTAALLTGTLTLNAEGNPDAVFVFQIGTSLTTASGSSVVTIKELALPSRETFWPINPSRWTRTRLSWMAGCWRRMARLLWMTIPSRHRRRRRSRGAGGASRTTAARCSCSAQDWRLWSPSGIARE
jgi:hypothetical protein